jgi:hypothetical protein
VGHPCLQAADLNLSSKTYILYYKRNDPADTTLRSGLALRPATGARLGRIAGFTHAALPGAITEAPVGTDRGFSFPGTLVFPLNPAAVLFNTRYVGINYEYISSL